MSRSPQRTVVVVFAALLASACGATAAGGGRRVTNESPGRVAKPKSAMRRPPVGARRPPIVASFIPFGARRKAEMRAYARRHYGIDSYRIVGPHLIVEHYTGSQTFASAFNTFVPDMPDSELRELPGICAHFVIDRDGTIHQLVSLTLMCRHTVGLNWTAIGIEHVGTSDAEVLGNRRQLRASLELTRWLQVRFGIATANVIGHNESLSSPFHHERVARLRNQTHDDWRHADMVRYRRLLRRYPAKAASGPRRGGRP